MKTSLCLLIITLASATMALSAPVGLCLHAYSQDAPAEKVECFEFARFEPFAKGYRFFLDPKGTKFITKNRYRGYLPYKPNLKPEHPEFAEMLESYEKAARKYPSTRPYLHPKIVAMRSQLPEKPVEKSAGQQARAALPKIAISGKEYLSPKYKTIEKGKLILFHKDGIAKIEIDNVTDSELQSLAKIDPSASQIKNLEISGNQLWIPSFENLSSGKVNIKHANGILKLDFDLISKEDRDTIMSWSDGSWKIGKPGYYSPNQERETYGEVILESGKFHSDVHLVERIGDSVSLKTSKLTLKFPIHELASIPGLTDDDSSKIDGWIEEIVEERLARATPKETNEILSEVLRVTDVRARILQVLDEGVLASKFVGTLRRTQNIMTSKTVTAEHPVTGEEITKILDNSTNTREFTEKVTDDLCYIVGNTANLTDGELVKVDSMRLLGRHQYTDVRGVRRSVRKYHAD